MVSVIQPAHQSGGSPCSTTDKFAHKRIAKTRLYAQHTSYNILGRAGMFAVQLHWLSVSRIVCSEVVEKSGARSAAGMAFDRPPGRDAAPGWSGRDKANCGPVAQFDGVNRSLQRGGTYRCAHFQSASLRLSKRQVADRYCIRW